MRASSALDEALSAAGSFAGCKALRWVDIDRVEGPTATIEFGVDVELHEFDRAVTRELADDREARDQGA